MALSMTGYGRGVKSTADYTVSIDMKSVNHRYLDIFFKIPKIYSYLEDRMRRDIQTRLSRGKIEITVAIERHIPKETNVELNKGLLEAYIKTIREAKTDFHLKGSLNLQSMMQLPDIFKISEADEDPEKLIEIAGQALDNALTALIEMRKTEGNELCNNLRNRLEVLLGLRAQLVEWAPMVVVNYQEKLLKRVQELAGNVDVDPNRLATEVAFLADKADVTEELERIESHVHQFLQTLGLSEPIGRRLDFLIQELNREINTVGSKAYDLKISQTVINFKVELEKMREQIQNIE